MLAEIPPHLAVSDFVRRVKGRSSHRVQMELFGVSGCRRCVAGVLTRGSIRTFPATAETENTASYQGGAWLRDLPPMSR
jgi:hypothetical protein